MTAGEELQALHPDQVITLAGEQVTVREFRFIEGMRINAIASALLEDLAGLILPGASPNLEIEPLLEVFGRHDQVFEQMLSISTGRPAEWIRALSDEDGRLLSLTFWTVNSGFFVRRLMTRVLSARLEREAGGVANPGSQTSTQH